MPSKTKLIEEAKALFADTEDPGLRERYQRLFGEFRRLLAECEKENDRIKEQLEEMGGNVQDLQGLLQAERNANRARDGQLQALRTEIEGLRRAQTEKEFEILRRDQMVVGGKRINSFEPEILNYVTHGFLQTMIEYAVSDYNQGARSSEVRGFEEKLVVATDFERRFVVVISAQEVDIFFLDENQLLEWALRDPHLHKKTGRIDEAL